MSFSCPTVYQDILTWSKGRPLWQRDALRRLFEKGEVDENDIEDILSLCKSSHQIAEITEKKRQPVPLDETHIPGQQASEGDSVRVISISDLRNINAISSQQPLTFGEQGLTIIYGDNGAGKSGFVRVLKNVCRARHVDKRILPNVFSASAGSPQTAKIEYRHGNSNFSFDWVKGSEATAPLAGINVFDARCASVYVNEENNIAYAPLGLDVFSKVSKACDTIKVKLSSEKAILIPKIQGLPSQYEETAAGRWYKSIDGETSEKEFQENTGFAKAENERLEDLKKILSEKSKRKRATELRMKKERYTILIRHIQIVASAVSPEAIQRLKDMKTNLDIAAKAAEMVTKEAFAKEPLKGVGTDAWQELWVAARKFSETVAYLGEEFPYTGPSSRCVLCFQDLQQNDKARLNRFKEYVQGETARKEADARKAFEAEYSNLTRLEIEKEDQETILKELGDDDEQLRKIVDEFIKAVKEAKANALILCEKGIWQKIAKLPENPESKITELSGQMETLAKSLEDAEDPETLKKYELQHNELEARKWVSGQKDLIQSEITRQKMVKNYENAISETDTTQITKTSTQLTDRYVTQELKNRFRKYLASLCHQGLSVSIEKKEGGKGITYYHVQPTNCTYPDAPVCDIISEGEFRAVAIAAFLAEISLSPNKSGVVLDDPVCSFDHLIREKVALQLVDVSKERQVIIFTHDLFFLVTLNEIADKEKVLVHNQLITRDYCGPGACSTEVPWEALKLNMRLNTLVRLVDEAESKYKSEGRTAYEPLADQICKKFRQTVERAIEEVLLLSIVQRYRRNIYATKVRQLSKIKKEDCILLDELMTEYSKFLHDQAEESRVPLPEPARFREDLKKLQEWSKEFSKREETPAAQL